MPAAWAALACSLLCFSSTAEGLRKGPGRHLQENSSDATMRALLQLTAGRIGAAGLGGAGGALLTGGAGVMWGGSNPAATPGTVVSTSAVAQGSGTLTAPSTPAPLTAGAGGVAAMPGTLPAATTGAAVAAFPGTLAAATTSGAASFAMPAASTTQMAAEAALKSTSKSVLTAGSANANTVGAMPGTATLGGSNAGITTGIVGGSASAVSAAAALAAAAGRGISSLTTQAAGTGSSSSSSSSSSLTASGTTKKAASDKACAKGQKRCPNSSKCVVVTNDNCGNACSGPCGSGMNCNFASGTCAAPCNNACQSDEVCTNNQCLKCTAAQGMQMCGTNPYTAGCLPLGKSC